MGSSDFARRYFRNLVHLAMLLISLPGVLRWFSSPSFASCTYFIQYQDARPLKFSKIRNEEFEIIIALYPSSIISYSSFKNLSGRAGYPIRPSADHRMCAPPRSFSQLATAFFASIRLGIRHKPVFRLTILLFLLKRFTFELGSFASQNFMPKKHFVFFSSSFLH